MKLKERADLKINKKIRDPRPEIDLASRAFFHFGKIFTVLNLPDICFVYMSEFP